MNVQEYIDSGVVLDYSLGLMTGEDKESFELALTKYPELMQELKAVQSGLEKYASAYSQTPAAKTKGAIWSTLENILLESQMDMQKLPLINKYSDHKVWHEAIKPILPSSVGAEPFMHVLTQSDTVTQVLVMSSTDIPDEVHEDVFESFIILDGECECHIGNDTIIKLKAGGYVEIPLHEHHDVKIISDYVVGIMQRVAA